MTVRSYHIVLNARSGTALGGALTAEHVLERFQAAGMTASIDADMEAELGDRIAAAVAGGADVIVAAGGDGTVTALASALIGTDKTLAIVPLGTANLLARDLGVPLGLEEAVIALPAMAPKRIDVGEVNGRVFLHKVVLGFAPEVAAGREKIRDRTDLAAKVGFARYFFKRLACSQKLTVDVTLGEGRRRVERVRSIAVANNAYDEGFGRFFARKRLDRGSLSVYILKRFNVSDLVRLSAGMLLGRWRAHEALTIETVRDVEINAPQAFLQAMVDGEVEPLDTPLRFRIRPLALSIMAPAAATADENPPAHADTAP